MPMESVEAWLENWANMLQYKGDLYKQNFSTLWT